MEPEEHAQQQDEVYGPPMPGLTGTMKIGPIIIAPRWSVWLIAGGFLLFNLILAGLVVLAALIHEGVI